MRMLSVVSPRTVLCSLAACLAMLLAAQQSPAADPPKVAAKIPLPGAYRNLVPGVETTIPPDRQEEETASQQDIVELIRGVPGLEWKPKFSASTSTLHEMATKTVFRRNIWCLEFTFKPVRMIWVDEPQKSGGTQRKLIWYMIYHVRNTGGHLAPTKQDDGQYTIQPADFKVRFFPEFVLESHEYKKSYLDRIIPVAIAAIQAKEDPRRKLLNSVEVGAKLLEVSTDLVDNSVWGVATWEDVDPRIDFFSVYVKGLSNAYRWVDSPEEFKPGDPPGTGRHLLQKTLVLNFWRPGDEYVEDQRTIRFGIPGQVDYRWIYR